MWVYNSDNNKWGLKSDIMSRSDFEYQKQELKATRFYSKFLSGATYVPVSDTQDIYDILGKWRPKSWFVSSLGSVHSETAAPTKFATPIDTNTAFDYYTRFNYEYGLTLKNLFTPKRIIRDSLKNIVEVDVATVDVINVNSNYASLSIDGVTLTTGNRILVKNQTTIETIDSTIDPSTYFKSKYQFIRTVGTYNEYSYYNNDNGIYTYDGIKLIKDSTFNDYEKCARSSVYVKSGSINSGKNFNLERLLSGYFPTASQSDPMEFNQKNNWLLRNRVDYNNLFEINYYDVIRHSASQYQSLSVTYSIPERTISVGEFGVILNTQYGISTVVPNKYKVNLRAITHTSRYYWVCGDDSTLLKINKHDFEIERIKVDGIQSLKSISFYDENRGCVVGDFNTILITLDGGQIWKRMKITDFAPYTYNKVVFAQRQTIYIAGRSGVFIELSEGISGWSAYKRRISKFIDDDDEYILVDNINDILYTTTSTWSLSYNYHTQTVGNDKKILIMVTDNGNIIVYDVSGSTIYNFLYLEFPSSYGDIINISRRESTDNFYFTSNSGLYQFDINQFDKIGVDNSYSNTITSTLPATLISNLYANETFDYKGKSLHIAGNNSLLRYATYSTPTGGTLTPMSVPDAAFEGRLRSKFLIMDYDIASKLNFFTDQGDYRLPSSVTFDVANSGGKLMTFTSSTAPSTLTTKQSTVNIVIPNVTGTRGKVREVRLRVNISCVNMSQVALSLIKLDGPGKDQIISIMKFGQAKITPNLQGFTFTTNDYEQRLFNIDAPYTGKTARMDLTPPTFQLVGTNTIINSNTIQEMYNMPDGLDMISGKWQLLVSNYGDPSTNQITITNWALEFVMENSYLSIVPKNGQVNWIDYRADSLKTFEYWSLPPSDASTVLMSTDFVSHTSYSTTNPYELFMTMATTNASDLDLLFPARLYGEESKYYRYSNPDIDLTTNYPTAFPGGRIYLWNDMMVLQTDINWKVSKGDMLRIESNIIDANVIVNKIITNSANVVYVYAYTGFNENIVNSLSSTYLIIRNLNTYQTIDELVTNFNIHEISNAYSLEYSGRTMSISAKFTNDSAYYNLAAVANFSGVDSHMSYTDGFLKFGYLPGYNLLDYLTSINKSQTNPTFYPDKEYLAMPVYTNLMMSNPWSPNSVYIDASGMSQSKYINDGGNKLVFGTDLRLEWQSLFINTFVDVHIYQPATGLTYSATRLLVMDKYEKQNFEGSGSTGLVVEFNKRINYSVSTGNITGAKIQIRSRRKLSQISEDLMELDNISKPKHKINEISSVIGTTATFSTYGSELNGKIPTDSYTKILLSDAETVKEISAVMYTDYKNELAMNITRLDRAYNIRILNTSDYNGRLFINCSEKHELQIGDAVVLDFDGGEYSSQIINQQYFGYQSVYLIINEYDFVVDVPYGLQVFVGNDTGTLRYLRKDPFFNYQPVDIIEIGSDKKPKVAVQLDPDNVMLTGATFSLTNVDWNRYRYRLVDGLTLDTISDSYSWILDAEISGAVIGANSNGIVWYKGIWESGRWFGGDWISGIWRYGDWYGGNWYSHNVNDKKISVDIEKNTSGTTYSVWQTGRWYDGNWNDGTWANGRWYGGNWNAGEWYNGIWNDGTWNSGKFIGGIWVRGTWNEGIFNCDNEPAFWIDGSWNSGDFENGIWYNGNFSGSLGQARFGTKAYNSRTAIWYGGKWKSGSFYSGISGLPGTTNAVSEVHKYSIWYSGQWQSGDWYGGIAYNMALSTGTWHGGILEDIQIIGLNSMNNSLILNGIFRFVLGDKIYVIDKNIGNEFSDFGNNSHPGLYTVLKTIIDEEERITEVFISTDISTENLTSYRKSSGVINEKIPNNSTFLALTQSVAYDIDKTNEIRVRLNIKNYNIGDLLINLRSPNGEVINVKEFGPGGTMSYPQSDIITPFIPNVNYEMVETVFSTETYTAFEDEYSPYTGIYEMSKKLGVGQGIYTASSMEYHSLTDSENKVKGDWTLFIKDIHADVELKHSTNNSVFVTYTNVGDPMVVNIVGPGSQWLKFRKGDNLKLDVKIGPSSLPVGSISANSNTLSTAFSVDTTIDTVYGYGNNTKIVLAATASSSYNTSFFTVGSYKKTWANILTSSNPNAENKVISWDIEFVNDYEVGAQIGYPRENGFDTGLRVVSRFRNANWKSGIWTNGIYDSGKFEGGIWMDGIFKGVWG
jgi:subtilisin-like proprotein convertase family protein